MGEFNVNKTDGSLEQTAGMPSEYPASQVMLSDGVTSVEDAVDELDNRASADTFGTAVAIGSYTSANPYVCPSDGYVNIALSGAGSMGDIYVEGINLMRINAYSGNNYPIASVFIKKGMHVYLDILSGVGSGNFYPLEGSALPSAESEGF